YRTLNTKANSLASKLVGLGVKPGDHVAILLERSFELVIAQLAILKAGAAYVPIAINAPVDRQAYIASNSGAKLLITNDYVDVSVKIQTPLLRFAEYKEQDAIEQEDTFTGALSSSDDTAYVMYTSGSTGLPKGVMVPHRGIVRLIINNGYAEISPHDRIAFATNPSFDPSTFDVWAPLLHGARMVIIDHDTYTDAYRLAEALDRHQITALILTMALFHQYAFIIGPALSKLKYLICGGEQGLIEAFYEVLKLGGPVRLINAYGPTEATTIAATYEVNGTIDQLDRLPIGRPISNTQAYVLDKYRKPVPIGVIGELYIGGPGVAIGYFNRPDLTAERFLPDPFSKVPGARMYKSGDLVRYLSDGNIVFMGRNDDQVKIRGYRIELGEIEERLAEHPEVREVAVLAIGESSSDKRLVAYVVSSPHEKLAHILREHLSASLPEYMVPSAFVRMDVFPLTNNGKVDRRALPAPDSSSFVTQDYVSPEGDIEVALAVIWSEVLKIDRIGRHDNFFTLGGHSLLAVRLTNRISALGVQIPLSTLFASPTLSALAVAVSRGIEHKDQSLSTIKPVSRGGILELSFAQQRLWFLAQMDGVSDVYHMPLALRLRGALDKDAWRRTLDTQFARHESLRTFFVTINGQPQVQLLPADQQLPLPFYDLSEEKDKEGKLKDLSTKEVVEPFDLAKGPLVRACLIQLADDEHVFMLTQHHIISDGWSIGVLMRELSELYSSFSVGGSDPLQPLGVQYPDYAAWQRQWLTGDRLQEQGAYWRETLAGAPVSIDLPTDRPRPSMQSHVGAYVPIHLDAQISQVLRGFSQKHGTTMFMTVLTAWSAVLSRLSGQTDIVIGTPSANRNHHQVEQLIGFFVNTLALRIDLSGEPSTNQLLERVRQSTVAAQAHQDLPFEQVVEIAQPPRRMDQTPLFQVLFAWQNNDVVPLHLPGVEAEFVDQSYDIAKFDLELELYEDKEQIFGSLRYATALFNRDTIERQVGYLKAMLQSMTADEAQPIATIDLLAPKELELLLQAHNLMDRPYPENRCIHQLFEDQVQRSPDAIALVYKDNSLTYGELNARSNYIAASIIDLGVNLGDYVAILLKRSFDLVAVQLAILKVGAVYVPIDVKAPVDRQAYIVSDCGAKLLITDETTETSLAVQTPLLRLSMDQDNSKCLQ
ncbi:hypothetical protein BGX28_000459, partial [Mortierella sp. GBA30]